MARKRRIVSKMKKHLKVFACYFRLNLASTLEYRASFFTQAFGMALSNSAFIFFWWIAFGQIGGSIAGYGFEDVIFIWAVTSSAFGLANVLFTNASRLTSLVVTGELDTFMLQPCNILVNILCAKTSLSAYGDLIYGFVLMSIFHLTNLTAWLWFLSGILIGCLVFTAIAVTAHTLSFYIGDATIIGNMALEFAINFSIYPDKIFAPAVRALMYSVIPMGFAVHLPLRLIEGFSPLLTLVALGGAIIYSVLSCGFFYRGLRRYESGNVIVTRQ